MKIFKLKLYIGLDYLFLRKTVLYIWSDRAITYMMNLIRKYNFVFWYSEFHAICIAIFSQNNYKLKMSLYKLFNVTESLPLGRHPNLLCQIWPA